MLIGWCQPLGARLLRVLFSGCAPPRTRLSTSSDDKADVISGVARWLGGQVFKDRLGVVGCYIAMTAGFKPLSFAWLICTPLTGGVVPLLPDVHA